MASRIEAKINTEDLLTSCDCGKKHPVFYMIKENPFILYNEEYITLFVSKCKKCGKQVAFRVGDDIFDIYNK